MLITGGFSMRRICILIYAPKNLRFASPASQALARPGPATPAKVVKRGKRRPEKIANGERRMAHKIMAKMRSYSDAICTRHRWEWVSSECMHVSRHGLGFGFRALGHFITPVPSGHAPALQRKLLEIYLFIGQVQALHLPLPASWPEGAIKTGTLRWIN